MLVLLGPQRFRPTLRRATESLGVEGPVAVVTAGWQERESEDTEMARHLEREVLDLHLYRGLRHLVGVDRVVGARDLARTSDPYSPAICQLAVLLLPVARRLHGLEAFQEPV